MQQNDSLADAFLTVNAVPPEALVSNQGPKLLGDLSKRAALGLRMNTPAASSGESTGAPKGCQTTDLHCVCASACVPPGAWWPARFHLNDP